MRNFTRNGMPLLEVELSNDRKGYLSPFRGYCFQVSGTPDGVGTIGSSPVVGFGNLAVLVNSQAVEEAFSTASMPPRDSLSASNVSASGYLGVILTAFARQALAQAGVAKFRSYEDERAFEHFILEVRNWLATAACTEGPSDSEVDFHKRLTDNCAKCNVS